MKENINKTDRYIRILLAVIIGALYGFNIINGTLAYVLMFAAIIFLVTSFLNFCPLYRLLGISTCKIKK